MRRTAIQTALAALHRIGNRARHAFGACAALLWTPTLATPGPSLAWGVQSTYIYQYQPGFNAPYSGPNSLLPGPAHGYSFSATGMLAARPWVGGEVYFEPETVSSIPISNLTGLGGLTNGENQKGGCVRPEVYAARVFVRQTWNLGGSSVKQEASLTQLPTTVDSRRLVLTAGNYAITDIFDTGNYSGDPRNTFLNWSFLTYGAWDYAADVRGYTWGATLSFHDRNWAVRAGRFLEPVVSNGSSLDTRFLVNHGDQIEIEHGHELAGNPGFVKLLLYRNVANMGSYSEAVDQASAAGGTPNLASTRRRRAKVGIGIHLEQQVTPSLGIFARLAAAVVGHSGVGKTEAILRALNRYPKQVIVHEKFPRLEGSHPQVVWISVDVPASGKAIDLARNLMVAWDAALHRAIPDREARFLDIPATRDGARLLDEWRQVAISHFLGVLHLDEVQNFFKRRPPCLSSA